MWYFAVYLLLSQFPSQYRHRPGLNLREISRLLDFGRALHVMTDIPAFFDLYCGNDEVTNAARMMAVYNVVYDCPWFELMI